MTKIEKIENLQKILQELKQEFVGLDNIIDEIGNSITPWYITPEVIKRPVVISLWGMTGTGKSSVAKRLIEKLNYSNKALFFDCGEAENDDYSINSKITEFLDLDDGESNNLSNISKDFIFVFDEFQHARTIDESGSEVNKSNLRPIWNVIDNGMLSVTDGSRWDTTRLIGFTEDILSLVKEYPGIKVNKGYIENKDDVKKFLEIVGIFYSSNRDIFDGFIESSSKRFAYLGDIEELEEKEKNTDPLRPIKAIEDNIFMSTYRKLRTIKPERAKSLVNDFISCSTLDEVAELLVECRDLIMTPRVLDCSKSLIFIIGNLDEAFTVNSDINPDMDADIFFDETSKVSINDIKEALKKRFRSEQIARIGNTIIKYPVLKREHFEKIIENELNRLCNEFESNYGINITIQDSFKKLIYAEGVYPVQGVRPVFTTIGTIFTPLFSKILIFTDKAGKDDWKVNIKTVSENFNTKNSTIIISYRGKDRLEQEDFVVNLTLGELRDPKSRKTRTISSVHEAGHAIVFSYLTGTIPSKIVSVSTDRGGFCVTYDKDSVNEIDTRNDVENDVMISLAGYEAERLIFGDRPEMLLMGSYSDIEKAWEGLSNAVYKEGFFDPYFFCNNNVCDNDSGIPNGLEDSYIREDLKDEFEELREETSRILDRNKKLLLLVAKYLSTNGIMSDKLFEKYIRENESGTLNEERLKRAKEDSSEVWYDSVLDYQIKKMK